LLFSILLTISTKRLVNKVVVVVVVLWSLLTTYEVVHELLKEPIIGLIKSKMGEIRHLEYRHDVIYSAEGGSIWTKLRRLVQNNTSTAVIWSKSKQGLRPGIFLYVA